MSCAGTVIGSTGEYTTRPNLKVCANCGKPGAAYYRHRKEGTTIAGRPRYYCGRVNYFRKMYGTKSAPNKEEDHQKNDEIPPVVFLRLCLSDGCVEPALGQSSWCATCITSRACT